MNTDITAKHNKKVHCGGPGGSLEGDKRQQKKLETLVTLL